VAAAPAGERRPTDEIPTPADHREPAPATVGRRRIGVQPRRRPVRLRSESPWLPAEWVFGLLLLLVAAGAAVLVLSGTIHIPGAP
jgi:hypothetical protein